MTLRLTPANRGHLHLIIGLIEEAAHWLRGKGTDQWERPWPSREERDARILDDILAGEAKPDEPKTWLVWNDGIPAATITTDKYANTLLWNEEERKEGAAYVRRLIVSRGYAGIGLGSYLLNWAGNGAVRHYGAQWIRVDVWTENEPLHRYYKRQGFRFVRFHPDVNYPSRALFQKTTDLISEIDGRLIDKILSRRLRGLNGRPGTRIPAARSHEQQYGRRHPVRADSFHRSC
jgi:GNAT superfamily N-acetyltransferase